MDERITVDMLTVGEVLITAGGGTYVVRQMHFISVREAKTRRWTQQLAGFTLLETKTVTDREVGIEELEDQLKRGAFLRHRPPVVRRIDWMLQSNVVRKRVQNADHNPSKPTAHVQTNNRAGHSIGTANDDNADSPDRGTAPSGQTD